VNRKGVLTGHNEKKVERQKVLNGLGKPIIQTNKIGKGRKTVRR